MQTLKEFFIVTQTGQERNNLGKHLREIHS